MFAKLVKQPLWLLLASHVVDAKCQPIAPMGGLTILTKNEVDGAANNGTGAILVDRQLSYYNASGACGWLRETVWDPRESDFNKTLRTALGYRVYQGLASQDQAYWVFKADSEQDVCRSINANGDIADVSCETKLPVLCSQMAPASNSSFADDSERFQVNQTVAGSVLTGFRDYHTFKFRGIRYAKQPERFTYSSPQLEPGRVMAVKAGADCVQPIGEVTSGSSEDCLFMNIWTTHLPNPGPIKSSTLKPVLLYIYGGGQRSGSGKNSNTDGTNMASRGDVVSISINYRVGAHGFLAFDDGVHKGNYAISDMVSALEWIQKYIHFFGGDASKVTISGESSGAYNVNVLLGSPRAKGLFRGAISMSNYPGSASGQSGFGWSQYASVESAYKDQTTKFLQEQGCLNATDQIACLKQIDGFAMINGRTNPNGVVVDGTYVVSHELELNRPGVASDVAVMIGYMRDEGGVYISNPPRENDTFVSYFKRDLLPIVESTSNFLDQYSLSAWAPGNGTTPGLQSAADVFNSTVRFINDGVFVCMNQAEAYTGAKFGSFESVYAFQFNRSYSTRGYTKPWCDAPKTAEHPNGDPNLEHFKCHASEQLIVWGSLTRRADSPDRDGNDVPYIRTVMDYWSSFVRTKNPNPEPSWLRARGYLSTLQHAEETGPWEPVNPENPKLRLLQWKGGMMPFPDKEQCEALRLPLTVLE